MSAVSVQFNVIKTDKRRRFALTQGHFGEKSEQVDHLNFSLDRNQSRSISVTKRIYLNVQSPLKATITFIRDGGNITVPNWTIEGFLSLTGPLTIVIQNPDEVTSVADVEVTAICC